MYNVQGRAYQTRSGIYVLVSGLLANSCMRAQITGTYPGSVVHIVDPGHGEVFIREWRDPGTHFCAQHLVPWSEHALLPGDFGHKEVAIYINDALKLTVRVEGQPTHVDTNKEWVVTALDGAPAGPYLDCAIHHQGDIILAIYRRVFGPDTRAACETFKAQNCTKLDL